MNQDSSRRYTTFNGEIFNYLELKKELKAKGYDFKSNTDTEVLLSAFIEWDADCLHRLNGMFAFAVMIEKAVFVEIDMESSPYIIFMTIID